MWSAELGALSVECGAWNVECEVWSVLVDFKLLQKPSLTQRT